MALVTALQKEYDATIPKSDLNKKISVFILFSNKGQILHVIC